MSRHHAAGGGRASLVGVASAVVLSLIFSACGGGGRYRYVKSADNTAFFKVPSKWKAFDTRELVLAEAQVNEQLGHPQSIDDLRLNAGLNWRVGFDASSQPSPINVVVAYNDQLVVDVRVRTLLPDERKNVSVDQLRNLSIPIDELAQKQADALKNQPPDLSINRDFEVRVDQEVKKPGGFHGVQTIVDLRAPAPDNRVFVFNQIALVDSTNSKLYVLSIHCETLCYERNRGTVLEVIKSFTLQSSKK